MILRGSLQLTQRPSQVRIISPRALFYFTRRFCTEKMFLQTLYNPRYLPLSPLRCPFSSFSSHSNCVQPCVRPIQCLDVLPHESTEGEETGEARTLPTTKPRKPSRRGRRSEAAKVEDLVRDSLSRTFASIKQNNPEVFENFKDDKIFKERRVKIDEDGDDDVAERGAEFVVDEESPNWPVDADIGWGIRASEYFEQHPIKNVVGEDGAEIDWEGEVENSWVKEINCLEWESFAFHPSPLIVLVFERYNRASENWKVLKELEHAIKVYWSCKDRLPPRAVKVDINIERDLSYALKVRDCPQILFLRGNKILYREKDFRTADELVQMIAHFYYNAKKPSWVDDTAYRGFRF